MLGHRESALNKLEPQLFRSLQLQLSHALVQRTTALYLQPRAKMMQVWEDYLELTQRNGKALTVS